MVWVPYYLEVYPNIELWGNEIHKVYIHPLSNLHRRLLNNATVQSRAAHLAVGSFFFDT